MDRGGHPLLRGSLGVKRKRSETIDSRKGTRSGTLIDLHLRNVGRVNTGGFDKDTGGQRKNGG